MFQEIIVEGARRLVESGMVEFTVEDLVVAAWKVDQVSMGLKGFAEYPDSNKVKVAVYGKKGLIGRGVLVRVPSGMLTLGSPADGPDDDERRAEEYQERVRQRESRKSEREEAEKKAARSVHVQKILALREKSNEATIQARAGGGAAGAPPAGAGAARQPGGLQADREVPVK